MKRLFGAVSLILGYNLFNEKLRIILSLNQSVFLVKACSASSKIDFSRIAGIVERA